MSDNAMPRVECSALVADPERTNSTRETTRWVVEWWHTEWKMWCAESLMHTTREDGDDWLCEAVATRPNAAVRLVEVIERRTIVKKAGARSANA